MIYSSLRVPPPKLCLPFKGAWALARPPASLRPSFRADALSLRVAPRAIWLALLALCSLATASATTVEPPTFDRLVNESDYVVHALTKSVIAEKRVSADGKGKIVTRVELEVIEVIAGTPPPKIILEFLGGRVGREQLTVQGSPQFRAGDEDILFVSGNGRSICPLYAMMHGRYLVQKDPTSGRKRVARSDGSALENTQQVAAPIEAHAAAEEPRRQTAALAAALDPTAFISQIRAQVKPDSPVSRGK